MKLVELKQMDDAALKGKLIELRKEVMGLRFKRVAGEFTQTHQFRLARRTIARVKTLLNQRASA